MFILDERGARSACARSRAVRPRRRPTALVRTITVGQQQRVEILKALYRGAEILILDEPTAVLTPQEAMELFGIVKSLQADGKSIIFISHKLNEVLEIGDRTTVLRRGKKIETVPCAGATEDSLAEADGRARGAAARRQAAGQPGEPLLTIEDLNVARRPRDPEGEGRVVRRARGRDRRHRGRRRQRPDRADRRDHGPAAARSGAVKVAGRDLSGTRASAGCSTPGVGHIPEDRQRRGLVLEFSIAENIALHDYPEPPIALGLALPEPPRRTREDP